MLNWVCVFFAGFVFIAWIIGEFRCMPQKLLFEICASHHAHTPIYASSLDLNCVRAFSAQSKRLFIYLFAHTLLNLANCHGAMIYCGEMRDNNEK